MENEIIIEEVKEKKKGKGLLVTIVVLILVILGLCGYIAYDKGWVFSSKTNNAIKGSGTTSKNSDTKDKSNLNSDSKLVSIDLNKNLSNSKIRVTSVTGDTNDGINVATDNTQKKVNYSFNANKVNKKYSLGWVTSDENIGDERHEINFDKKVETIFIGGIGQTYDGDVVFFLMEDGTVEYIPVVDSFKNHRENPVSYGKIENVKDVVRFVNAGVCPADSQIGCYATTFAVTSDGSFYDLQAHIKEIK